MSSARSLRRRGLACVVALALAAGAAAVLVISVRQRDDALTELAHARLALHGAQAASSTDAQTLNHARHIVQGLRKEVTDITTGATAIGKLDDEDSDAVSA